MKYTCEHCGVSFDSAKDCKKHEAAFHATSNYRIIELCTDFSSRQVQLNVVELTEDRVRSGLMSGYDKIPAGLASRLFMMAKDDEESIRAAKEAVLTRAIERRRDSIAVSQKSIKEDEDAISEYQRLLNGVVTKTQLKTRKNEEKKNEVHV